MHHESYGKLTNDSITSNMPSDDLKLETKKMSTGISAHVRRAVVRPRTATIVELNSFSVRCW